MRIAYDQNGYSYDVDTGFYVSLIFDDLGNAYDASTGEPVSEVILDAMGTTVYTAHGGVDWNHLIDQAAQAYAANQGAAQTGRYIPQAGQTSRYGYDYPDGGYGVSAGVGTSRGGIGGSLNLSTNTLLLIAAGVMLFFFGQQRGGRR